MSSYFRPSPGQDVVFAVVAGGSHQIAADRNGAVMSLGNSDGTSDVSPGVSAPGVCVCVSPCAAVFEQQQ